MNTGTVATHTSSAHHFKFRHSPLYLYTDVIIAYIHIYKTTIIIYFGSWRP